VCKKVCVPAPDTKKVTHNCYRCKCEDVCLPKCGCPFHCHHECGDCCHDAPCAKCGHPHTRHILLKKIVTEECPRTKCVVQTVVEQVPCKPCHKAPCITTATACECGPELRCIEPPMSPKK